jgi:hypothetical protein
LDLSFQFEGIQLVFVDGVLLLCEGAKAFVDFRETLVKLAVGLVFTEDGLAWEDFLLGPSSCSSALACCGGATVIHRRHMKVDKRTVLPLILRNIHSQLLIDLSKTRLIGGGHDPTSPRLLLYGHQTISLDLT